MSLKYNDCQNPFCKDCSDCSLSSHGKDCHNNPCNTLAYYRKKAGMSQKELASIIGKPNGYICDIENGRRNINVASVGTIMKIAKAIGVTVEELVGSIDD